MMKILNLKLVTLQEYQNIKTFLQKAVPNCSEEFFLIKKVRNTEPWTYVISDLKAKEFLEDFTKNSCEKHIKKSLELKK